MQIPSLHVGIAKNATVPKLKESRLIERFVLNTPPLPCSSQNYVLRFETTSRRGFTIRLQWLKPRAPDFGGPQDFGSEDNFQHFSKHYIRIFVLVQRTFFYYAANKRSL